MIRHLALLSLVVSALEGPHAQPIAVDTLFAPSPTIIKNFGHTLETLSPSGSDSLFAFINEPQRSPDSVVDVFVYDAATNTWTVEDSLGWNSSFGDFGEVSISSLFTPDGMLVAVDNDGLVALWRRLPSNQGWVLEDRLEDTDPGGTSAAFGFGIDLVVLPTGEELVFIGAENGGDDPTGGSREGSAYAFIRPPGGTEWVMEQRILAPDGVEGDKFGAAVAIVPLSGGHPGDVLALVGAPGRDRGSVIDRGAVYVFVRDGSTATWSYETTLLIENDDFPTERLFFGNAVDVLARPSGQTGEVLGLLAASDYTLTGAGNTGVVYVWVRLADGQGGFDWSIEVRLEPDDPRGDLHFGYSLDLEPAASAAEDGGQAIRALIGTGVEDPFEDHPGAAYLFERNPVTEEWTQTAHYETGETGFGADRFGWSVALAGDLALVGAPWDTTRAFSAGAVYVFGPAVVASEPETPDERSALAVYPNPATESVTVTFHLPEAQTVRIALYDVLGREVAVLGEREFAAGVHSLPISTASMPAGVYVARVEGQNVEMARAATVIR